MKVGTKRRRGVPSRTSNGRAPRTREATQRLRSGTAVTAGCVSGGTAPIANDDWRRAGLTTYPKRPPTRVHKGDVVQMRVTAEQKVMFAHAAQRAGLGVSSWLRLLALRAAGVLAPLAISRP